MKTAFRNLCDTVIAGLRWNFVALNVYICKEEEKKINDMSFYFKKLGGKKEINPKPTKGNKKRQKLMIWKTIHIIEI